jgi:hypothetical protein
MIDTLISQARIKTSTKYNIDPRPDYTPAISKFVNLHFFLFNPNNILKIHFNIIKRLSSNFRPKATR